MTLAFGKQNRNILMVCERARSLIVRRTFLQVYILFIIFSIIHVCDGLDLGSWQVFLVGGRPWSGGSGSFLSPGRDKRRLCLPSILPLSGSSWKWHHLLGQAGGWRQPWVLALSLRWAVSDCGYHRESFEELAKPTPCILCRMMKKLVLGQLIGNSEGFYSKNMLWGQCYWWSSARSKFVNILNTLE